MQVLTSKETLLNWRQKAQGVIGFVPTMGALHEGHLSLVRQSMTECDWTVVSIFVNPRQFGPHEDFERYPRTPETDIRLLQSLGVSVVFMPSVDEMYSLEDEWHLSATRLSRLWCGAHRIGHFDGVALVLTKLFHLVHPSRAYFGEKDFQQVRIVEKMVEELFFPVQIVRHPTIREADGLAMSSRNAYLSPRGRAQAIALYKALQYLYALTSEHREVRTLLEQTHRYLAENYPEVAIEYLAVVDEHTLEPLMHINQSHKPRALIAAYVEGVRLIDNLPLYEQR